MELSDIEYNKAKHFLLKRNIQPEEIESFYFMKHHYRTGQYSPGTKIGASILTSTVIYTSFDYNTIYQQEWIRDTKFYILIPLCLSVTLLFWYFLLFRCNYIKTTSKALTIHGIICKTTLPYSHIRKVNFSRHFSRRPSPVLELIDDNFRYRKYILQGVSFKVVDEITQTLQSAGIDATNSNNQRD